MGRTLGDKAGEATALEVTANAHLDRKKPDEALEAAREAVALSRELGDAQLEAANMQVMAVAYLMKNDTDKAMHLAREALAAFREADDKLGESTTLHFIANAERVNKKESIARVVLDEHHVAHLEIDEGASTESLQYALDMLHLWRQATKPVKCILMKLNAVAQPMPLVSKLLRTGAFLMGLRAVGVPIICVVWGRVAGPTWGLFVCCDYRIASNDALFMLPPWGPPVGFKGLIGHAAVEMHMTLGYMNAMTMLGHGVLQSCRPSRSDALSGAVAFARKVAAFPKAQRDSARTLTHSAITEYCMTMQTQARW